VVGSQCDALHRLHFLPERAEALAQVLGDDALGRWEVELKLDPDHATLRQLIHDQLAAASGTGSIALIGLIGHGKTFDDTDYYFMPKDGTGHGQSNPDLLLTLALRESLRECANLKGLVLLIDTCESGVVATRADVWLPSPPSPYHIMTAALGDVVQDGNFTQAVIDVVRQGLSDSAEHLTTAQIYNAIEADPEVASRMPQQKVNGNSTELWLARNAAYDRQGHGLRRAADASIGVGGTGRWPLDGYRLPPDVRGPVTALSFSERDRVQLGVIWGLDRTPFRGVAVDLPGCDLAGDLDAVEETVNRAAASAGLELPRRRWVRLPVRPGHIAGFELGLDGPPPTAGGAGPRAFVLSVDIDVASAGLSVREWSRALSPVLASLRDTHPEAAVVAQLRTPSMLDGARTAYRVATAMRADPSDPEEAGVEVMARFVPGADEDRGAGPVGAAPAKEVDELIRELAAARGWDSLPPPAVAAAGLAAGLTARLGVDPATDGPLLDRLRVYASPLWRPVLRRYAQGSRPQAAVLEIAARLDEDLEIWLDARTEVGGPHPDDLPVAGHQVPDALARVYRWRAWEPPGWLVRRMSRPARAPRAASPAAELLDVLRRRPVSSAWAAEVVHSDVLRCAVRLVPPDLSDGQLLLHLEEVHAAARPAAPPVIPVPSATPRGD